jgi:N-acetylglucosaminyldiphosphoundecaprenol N-acetyl-beta-D-mannosaminyltransferase
VGIQISWHSFARKGYRDRYYGKGGRAFHRKGYRIFFFGAHEEIVKKTVSVFSERYSPSIVAGYRNGYFTKEEEPSIAEMIGKSILTYCLLQFHHPKRKYFLEEYKDVIKVPLYGRWRSFDVVAGFTKRAPMWMQKSGMEWFYRLIQEPGRMWKRYLITNTLSFFTY